MRMLVPLGVFVVMLMSMIVGVTMCMHMRMSLLSILLLFIHLPRPRLPLLTLAQIGHCGSLRSVASTCRTHHITSICLIFSC